MQNNYCRTVKWQNKYCDGEHPNLLQDNLLFASFNSILTNKVSIKSLRGLNLSSGVLSRTEHRPPCPSYTHCPAHLKKSRLIWSGTASDVISVTSVNASLYSAQSCGNHIKIDKDIPLHHFLPKLCHFLSIPFTITFKFWGKTMVYHGNTMVKHL